MVEVGTPTASTRTVSAVSAAALAEQAGLQPVGRRPGLSAYLRRVWESRFFLRKLSYLRYRANNDEDLLGAGWNVLRPLLQAGVYSLIFGVLLGVAPKAGGPTHRIVFITAGVFIFNYTSTSITGGAKSVVGDINLVRAMPFPRAVLPMASVLVETLSVIPAYIALCFIALLVHPPSVAWLSLAPLLLIQMLFNAGCVFIVARITVHVRDFAQFLPFIMRIWFYLSGVFYALDKISSIRHHPTIEHILQLNPPHVFINIARPAVMVGQVANPGTWLLATAWGVGMFLIGFLYFWQAEAIYGRN